MLSRKNAQPSLVRPELRQRRRGGRPFALYATKVLGAAVAGGLLVGAVSVPAVRQKMADASASLGLTRARAPQAGDRWDGCDDARAAGTAPIYSGEPGYAEEMDEDGDGIACEPYRG